MHPALGFLNLASTSCFGVAYGTFLPVDGDDDNAVVDVEFYGDGNVDDYTYMSHLPAHRYHPAHPSLGHRSHQK